MWATGSSPAANSRVTITLTDNSKLELDESTSLVIDQQMVTANSRNTKLSLFSGLVRSFVSYSSSPTPNFEVHTPNAVASARGTEYDTSTSDPAARHDERGRPQEIQGLPPIHRGIGLRGHGRGTQYDQPGRRIGAGTCGSQDVGGMRLCAVSAERDRRSRYGRRCGWRRHRVLVCWSAARSWSAARPADWPPAEYSVAAAVRAT